MPCTHSRAHTLCGPCRRSLAACRAEPRYGQRVPYVVLAGEPGARLSDMVAPPRLLVEAAGRRRLHALYYITRQLLPALERVLALVGADPRVRGLSFSRVAAAASSLLFVCLFKVWYCVLASAAVRSGAAGGGVGIDRNSSSQPLPPTPLCCPVVPLTRPLFPPPGTRRPGLLRCPARSACCRRNARRRRCRRREAPPGPPPGLVPGAAPSTGAAERSSAWHSQPGALPHHLGALPSLLSVPVPTLPYRSTRLPTHQQVLPLPALRCVRRADARYGAAVPALRGAAAAGSRRVGRARRAR